MKSDPTQHESGGGWAREFFAFLRFYRIWWLVPIVLILVLVCMLLMSEGTPLAPFVYNLF